MEPLSSPGVYAAHALLGSAGMDDEQCHRRAWNSTRGSTPRAKTKTTTALASNHVASLYPNRVFAYDGQYILNPG